MVHGPKEDGAAYYEKDCSFMCYKILEQDRLGMPTSAHR